MFKELENKKIVLWTLKEGYRYSGILINAGNEFLLVNDVKVGNIYISSKDILTLKEVSPWYLKT